MSASFAVVTDSAQLYMLQKASGNCSGVENML